ncbi:MAG TPA: DUF2628 domain-containing protein [Gemmatimonas sp.]|uniref:DUF2628 domain-containing protein n=1 Tax=Gemmatimonas sp. TaxID=1962908 RepID=UPI002EDA8852
MTSPTPDNRPDDRSSPDLPRWAQRPTSQEPLLSDERMATYFGAKWERVYKRKLAPFLEDPSFVPTWNWSAALALPMWFLYRKLYLPFAVFFLVPNLVFRLLTRSDTALTVEALRKPENEWLLMMNLAVHLSSAIAAGGTANWLLFRRARAASHFVSVQQLPPAEGTNLLRRMGGVNRLATALFVSLSLVIVMAQYRG